MDQPTTEESGDAVIEPATRPPGSTTEDSTTTTGVILIPPLGLDRVARLTEGFKEWWKKHGPNSTQAVIDAIAIIAEALKPTPPPSNTP